jgi:hypothetical protein
MNVRTIEDQPWEAEDSAKEKGEDRQKMKRIQNTNEEKANGAKRRLPSH